MVYTHINAMKYWKLNFKEEAWWRSVSGFTEIPEARIISKAADFNRFSSVETLGCYSCLVLYLHALGNSHFIWRVFLSLTVTNVVVNYFYSLFISIKSVFKIGKSLLLLNTFFLTLGKELMNDHREKHLHRQIC